MTTVASTSSVASTTSSSTATASQTATVDYNQFLTLMIDELQNQDPTSPSDPTQYMSQLASFSQVEQQIQTNTKLDSLLTTNSLSQAEGFIGKTVASADGTTTGTVSSVSLGTDGTATATLSNGSTLALGSGITVSGS